MKSRWTMARAVIALVLPVSATMAGTARASHGGNVHCGDVITVSTTLTGDVVEQGSGDPCTTDGVVIGASNITLDLNGFKIVGQTIAANGDEAGVVLNGVTGVTVTDESATLNSTTGRWQSGNLISGFDAGVALVNGASTNTIKKLNIVGNVGVDGDYGEGIHVRDSSGNTFKGNAISGNGPYAGVTLFEDSDNNNLGLTGLGNANYIQATTVTHQDIGIRLESLGTECTTNNHVINNTIEGSTIDGISILNSNACSSADNRIIGNTIRGNGRDGVRLNARVFSGVIYGAVNNHVHANTIEGNGGAGIRSTAATYGNHIHDNTVAGNNPVVVPPVSVSPLAPPHGDLHDGNVNCAPAVTPAVTANYWSDNFHVTEFAGMGSTLATTPTGGAPDYACID